MGKDNKNIALGAGAVLLSVVGFWWLKNKIPLKPKVPVVDDNTVLLLQYTYSPYCMKVAKYLDYKGIPYRAVNLLPAIQKGFVSEFSGQKKVPVVKYKGKIINDSTMIIKYFEEIFPEPTLTYKDEPELHHEIMLLEDWADEAFLPPIRDLSLIYLYEHPEVLTETDTYKTGLGFMDKNIDKIGPMIIKKMLDNYGVNINQKDLLKKRVRANLDLLSTKLENKEFLLGNKLTLADLAVATHLDGAKVIAYIYEDDLYSHIFEWQEKVFKALKRRFTAVSVK
ncbi:MAG: glutathione S-transferase family protein [Candidatus Sericytochromatia bacterium]